MIATIARRGRIFLLWALVAGGIAAAAWYAERRTASLSGPARVIDGDSLLVGGAEIRLFGIDAPEFRQTCARGGEVWRCGAEAARVLRSAIGGREVSCRPREQDRYGRTVAVCRAGGLDLGAAMIKGGFALSYGAYEADEREARDAGRGIWGSKFDPPAIWRAKHPRRER